MKLKLMILVLSGLLLFSCNPLTIKADYDVDVNFSEYKTYHWVKVKKSRSTKSSINMNPFIIKRIRKMVEANLMTKGLNSIESKKNSDLLLALYFHNKNKVNVSHVGYGYGPWYRSGVVVNEYKEGTMVIDFVDAEKRELIWRGIASGIAHKDDYSDEDVEYIVGRILKQFPPAPQE